MARIVDLPAKLRQLPRDQDGAVAIEFAYLAPVLLLMLLGTVEVSRAITIDRRFAQATSMVGDLVSREKSLKPTATDTPEATLEGMWKATQSVMSPYNDPAMHDNANSVTVTIRSVLQVKATGNPGTVKWAYKCVWDSVASKATCTNLNQTCQSYTLPNGVITKDNSVIVVESTYQYSPLFVNWTDNNMTAGTWNDKAINSPRQAVCVDDGLGNTTSSGCAAPTSCPGG